MGRRGLALEVTGTSPAPIRWGIYTRISWDKQEKKRGVKRQDETIEGSIEHQGGIVVTRYEENDTSAFKKRKLWRTDDEGVQYAIWRVIRPKWQQALKDLRAGVIDALMVYDLDRLARDPRDLEDAIEVVQYYNKRMEGYLPGQIDLTTDGGVTMARVITAMNNKSSLDTARRVRDAHAEGARKGYTPGGRRPFGYGPDPEVEGVKRDVNRLHPIESRYAKKAAKMLVAGETLNAVAMMMNEAGIKTSGGNYWDSGAVRQYFDRAYRLIGVRSLRFEVVYDSTGTPVRGKWDRMISDKEFYAIQEIFETNRKKQIARNGRPGSRERLLTGILRCGECGGNMTSNSSQNGTKWNYICRGRKWGFNHTLSITGPNGFEDLILDLVAERMGLEALKEPVIEWAGATRLREVKAEIKDAMAKMKAKKVTAARAFAMIEILEEEELELENQKKAHKGQLGRATTSRVDEKIFRAASVNIQRDVISDYISVIVVARPTQKHPGSNGGFDRDRITVEWKQED